MPQGLSTPVPVEMDDVRPGSTWESPWCFIAERAHKTCAQALVYHRKQDKHRDESPVDNAEETDSSLPISTCRTPYVRDDDDNQWSLGDKHLIKGGPRQIMFHSLITHHDELLWLCVPSRRIAGS